MPQILELCTLNTPTLNGQTSTRRYEISVPWSTGFPPVPSTGLISFQNTILICWSFVVRVTRTSPSCSNSSMACGDSLQESFNALTESPPPFRVWRCISVSSAALLRNVKSCWREEVGCYLMKYT